MSSSLGTVGVVISILSILVGTTLTLTPTSSLGNTNSGGTTSRRRTRLPPNSHDPDYVHSTSSGGHVGESGEDGAVIFIAKVPAEGLSTSLELRAQYFARVEEDGWLDDVISDGTMNNTTATVTALKKKEVAYQEYKVPGNERRGPYTREVTVKVWGAGGGGCDGGELCCCCCCRSFQ